MAFDIEEISPVRTANIDVLVWFLRWFPEVREVTFVVREDVLVGGNEELVFVEISDEEKKIYDAAVHNFVKVCAHPSRVPPQAGNKVQVPYVRVMGVAREGIRL